MTTMYYVVTSVVLTWMYFCANVSQINPVRHGIYKVRLRYGKFTPPQSRILQCAHMMTYIEQPLNPNRYMVQYIYITTFDGKFPFG